MAERQTRQVRIAEDLADKLAWVLRLGGSTSADRLDPMIRPGIEAAFAAIEPDVKRIEAAESRAARRKPLEHVDIGGES